MSDDNITVLAGIVGSRAYGLDTPDSDTDVLGTFLAPTRSMLGLNPNVDASDVRHVAGGDDSTFHELGKFLRLAVKANPTVSELLWLEEGLYLARTEVGERLIGIRRDLLSAIGVRNAYLGYAASQVHRVQREFATENRREKAARHTWRLLDQGLQLWRTGTMTLKVDRDACFGFGRRVADGDLDLLLDHFHDCEQAFDLEPTVLPADNRAGLEAADRLLKDVRTQQLIDPSDLR